MLELPLKSACLPVNLIALEEVATLFRTILSQARWIVKDDALQMTKYWINALQNFILITKRKSSKIAIFVESHFKTVSYM